VLHTAGTAQMTFNTAGTYEIVYTLSVTTGPAYFEARLNGSTISGTTYGTTTLTPTEIVGQFTIIVAAGDILTIHNVTEITPLAPTFLPVVLLFPLAPLLVPDQVNASVVIVKIAP
jgi:hypothetical protein